MQSSLQYCLHLPSVDHSRVKLSLTTSKNDNDYINASFIKVGWQDLILVY